MVLTKDFRQNVGTPFSSFLWFSSDTGVHSAEDRGVCDEQPLRYYLYFLEQNQLPAELLNCVSTSVIEVLPPTASFELAEMVLRAQKDLGVEVDPDEAQRVAKEIVYDRKGVRGIEAYILQKWDTANHPNEQGHLSQ